ncbi:MAG: triose-phosphate isomerase [Desulfobacteraceae bacterium]|nr:triose-phosphate isomerase [Desulfobacteraceae bacterium]MCF8095274.1 triose-phosphate isomerase [Desulfobacteraceae bacterium]
MTSRRPLIAGNWKMYKTCSEAEDTAREIVKNLPDMPDVEIMIAPPATALAPVFSIIRDTPVELGGQNMFWEAQGAYTGEVSGPMLVSAGCSYVIIGHSERRQYFGETDDSVNRKINAAKAAGLTPIICVGETETERDAEKTFSVLDKQMENGLESLSADSFKGVVIAYEPVWAIGTGRTATAQQAQEVHARLRKFLDKRFGGDIASQTRIVYGGSVKPENIAELMALEDIDGALVGGASLKPDTFSKIINYKR